MGLIFGSRVEGLAQFLCLLILGPETVAFVEACGVAREARQLSQAIC